MGNFLVHERFGENVHFECSYLYHKNWLPLNNQPKLWSGRQSLCCIIFLKFQPLIIAPKAPIFTFRLYFPLGRVLNVIGSFPLSIRYFVTLPKDIFMLYIYTFDLCACLFALLTACAIYFYIG